MTRELIFLSLLSGFVYIISPGPVFLNLAGVVAHKGIRAGFALITGSLIGDVLWIAFAMFSILFSYFLDQRIFLALAILCGSYLVFLGGRAVLSKPSLSNNEVLNPRKPFRRGFILGMLNPKSYPVLLATLTALIGEKLTANTNDTLIAFVFIIIGAVAADIIFIFVCSTPLIKKLFVRYSVVIVKIIGVIFLFFGGSLLFHSVRQGWL